MIYKNNDRLREYLHRGAAGAYREHLRHSQFEIDATAFAAALEQVRAQHSGLAGGEAEARAVFRLLTSGAPPEVAVPLPSLWWRASAFSRRAALLAWPWLKIAWAIALLLLAATAVLLLGERPAHAAPPPDTAPRNAVATRDVLRSLIAAQPKLHSQLGAASLHAQLAGGSTAARVQFLSSGAWTSVSSASPLPVTCISGCSGGGGGGGGGTSSVDESAFTEGTTAFAPAGGYYKSSFSSLSSGEAGSVALTANRAFHVTPYASGGSELFTSGNAGYVQFPSTPTVTVGNSSLAVTGTFWQTTQPVSGTFWQSVQPVSWSGQSVALSGSWPYSGALGTVSLTGTLPAFASTPTVTVGNASLAVTGTFWQTTQPVSGTFWQATQPVSCASASTCPVNATLQASSGTDIGKLDANQSVNLAQLNGSALGSPSNYGTSPGAVAVQGVNAFVTNTVQPQPQSSSTYAPAAYDLAATAATNEKSGAGNVWGWFGYNPNASVCYLQFYNSTSATLGTSPLHAFGVAPGASFNLAPGSIALFNLSTGISTGQTTTATGSTQCSSAMVATILYE